MLCLIEEERDYTLKELQELVCMYYDKTRGVLLGLGLKALDQSTQKVRLGKQILIDFRALPLINEFNTLGRTPGYVANSCWADS